MKKCVILFALLLVAICLFKINASDSEVADDKLSPKELASISTNKEIAKN